MKFLNGSAMRLGSSALGRELDGGPRAEERRLLPGVADAGQHFAGREHQPPDDESLGQQMRGAVAALPRGDAAPYTRRKHGTDADQIEDEPRPAAVGEIGRASCRERV